MRKRGTCRQIIRVLNNSFQVVSELLPRYSWRIPSQLRFYECLLSNYFVFTLLLVTYFTFICRRIIIKIHRISSIPPIHSFIITILACSINMSTLTYPLCCVQCDMRTRMRLAYRMAPSARASGK